MVGFLPDPLVQRSDDAPGTLLMIVYQLLECVPALVPQLLRGAGLWIVLHRIADVTRHLDREPAIDRHEREFEAGVNRLADSPEERDSPEGFPDVGGKHGDHGTLGGKGNLGKAHAILPKYFVLIGTVLGLVYTARGKS